MNDEKLYPNILASERTDGKLAYTENIWDKVQEEMQQAINAVLAKHFVFKNDGGLKYDTLDGEIIQKGSLDLDRFPSSLKRIFENLADIPIARLNNVVGNFSSLQKTVENIISRVTKLEQASDVGIADKKGFFLVDINDNIGACVIPDGTDGHAIALGWDDTAIESTPAYADGRGTKVLISGADFSLSGLGNLSEDRDLTSFVVVYNPGYTGKELTLNIETTPSDYEGTFSWRVQDGAQYVSVKSQEDEDGHSITYNILPAAVSGSKVVILCSSDQYPGMNPVRAEFLVNYSAPIEGVEILVDEESGPVLLGTSFEAVYTPVPENSWAEWSVEQGGDYITMPSSNKSLNPTRFYITRLASISSINRAVIKVTVHLNDGTSVSQTKEVFVAYDETDLEGFDVVPVHNITNGAVTASSAQVAVRAYPDGADPGVLTYDVPSKLASINANGELTLSPLAKVGDVFTVEVESDKVDGEGNPFKAMAILRNAYETNVESLTIEGAGSSIVGTGVQLKAVPTPFVEDFPVDWYVMVGNKYASVDDQGKVTIFPNAAHDFVVIRAIAKNAPRYVDQTTGETVLTASQDGYLQADISFYATYDTSTNPIVSIKHCGIVEGDKVTFHAFGYYKDGTFVELTDQSKLLWEVLWDYKVGEEDENNSSLTPIGIGGLGGIPRYGSNGNTIISGGALGPGNTSVWGGTPNEWAANNPVSGSSISSSQIIVSGVGGVLMMAASSTTLVFDSTNKNVLLLNSNDPDALQWAYVRCTYSPSGNPVSGEGVFFDWYHEFTYQGSKVAVGDNSLAFDSSKIANTEASQITINNSEQAVQIIAPKAKKIYYLRNLVSCSTSDSVFNKNNLIFETIDDEYCTLTNAGALTVKEGASTHPVTVHYGYRHSGDGVTIDTLRHTATNETVTLVLTRSAEEQPVALIKIVHAALYTSDNPGAIIDGGQLSVIDQNGIPRAAVFSLVDDPDMGIESSKYLSINWQGGDMRIFSTGGENKKVKVRAAYESTRTLTDEVTFEVRCN